MKDQRRREVEGEREAGVRDHSGHLAPSATCLAATYIQN